MIVSVEYNELNTLIKSKTGSDAVSVRGVNNKSFTIVYTHTTIIPIISKTIKKTIEIQLSISSASFEEVVLKNESGPLLRTILPTFIRIISQWVNLPDYVRVFNFDGALIRVDMGLLSTYIPALHVIGKHFTLDEAEVAMLGFVLKMSPK